MSAIIERIEHIKLAAARNTGPYTECEKAWNILCGWAGPKGLFGPETVFLGISHDDPNTVPAEKLRYDACISIPADVNVSESDAPVFATEIPAGNYATLVHEGPYEKLIVSWTAAFEKHLPELGKEFDSTRPCFEIYMNDPQHTAPEDLLTKICIPVK